MSAIDGKVLLTKNDCYKVGRLMTPQGIVVHSTGANNPTLRRYIAPDDGIIGQNSYGNDWNRGGLDVCVHGFIGQDKNGNVKFYQTLPFNYCCWGVGGGSKGSYNYSPAYIQFEMCEDDLTDKAYCMACYNKAVDVCAYLCKTYSINPNNIVSHYEAYQQGYGSGHVDPTHWWGRFGLTMDKFRADVKTKISETSYKTVNVKVVGTTRLFKKDYIDPVGKTSKSIAIKRGAVVGWVKDNKRGWSKVVYKDAVYYILNKYLKKSGLSSLPIKTISAPLLASKVRSGKVILNKTLPKGTKITTYGTIISGKYAGYNYFKRNKFGSYWYGKTVK